MVGSAPTYLARSRSNSTTRASARSPRAYHANRSSAISWRELRNRRLAVVNCSASAPSRAQSCSRATAAVRARSRSPRQRLRSGRPPDRGEAVGGDRAVPGRIVDQRLVGDGRRRPGAPSTSGRRRRGRPGRGRAGRTAGPAKRAESWGCARYITRGLEVPAAHVVDEHLPPRPTRPPTDPRSPACGPTRGRFSTRTRCRTPCPRQACRSPGGTCASACPGFPWSSRRAAGAWPTP